METVLVQINNNKAYKLFENLEELHVLKVLKESKKQTLSLSDKYAGKLTSKTADELQDFVNESREQWNNQPI